MWHRQCQSELLQAEVGEGKMACGHKCVTLCVVSVYKCHM